MDLKKLLLGRQSIESDDQERKVLLGAYLIILYFLIDLFFFIVNLFNPEGITWILISGSIASIVCLLFLRSGMSEIAIFIFLFRANFMIYFFASQENLETGTFIYFISYSILPLAFYGYNDRWKGIAYALVSFILFLLAKFEPANFTPDNPHFYFILNYTFVLLTAAFIILFFDRMNKRSVIKIDKQNKDLLKANEELDRFVYSVSHDLRSPLSSILGLVNIYDLSESPDERTKIVQMIKGRTLKLDEFIKKILDYSRNSRRPIKHTSINLHQIADDVLESLKFNPGFEGIQFHVNVPESQIVTSDLERLKIILTNLLSNAVKYVDHSKREEIVSISSTLNGSMLDLEIKDNGIGIKPEHLSKIFNMFYRADQASDGSGIGLYIVSECVNNLGGKVSVQSELGVGSTFTVSLPQP